MWPEAFLSGLRGEVKPSSPVSEDVGSRSVGEVPAGQFVLTVPTQGLAGKTQKAAVVEPTFTYHHKPSTISALAIDISKRPVSHCTHTTN